MKKVKNKKEKKANINKSSKTKPALKKSREKALKTDHYQLSPMMDDDLMFRFW